MRLKYNLLKHWMKRMTKTGVYIPFSLLAKIVTTKIWPSGVLDYSNHNGHWKVTLLSPIFLMLQYYFFLHNYRFRRRKSKSLKEENSQSTKEVWLRCMSNHEWHDITRYNLVMPQKSAIKSYNIRSISHHYICLTTK